MDAAVTRLGIRQFALKSSHVPVARSALISFNSLHRLTLEDNVPLDLLTDDFLVTFKNLGVANFEFRSKVFEVRVRDDDDDDDDWGGQDGHRAIVNRYRGGYPHLDAGLMAFLFRGSEAQDEAVVLNFPAARVPHDFCRRLLKVR